MTQPVLAAEPRPVPTRPVVVAIGSSADGIQNLGMILSAFPADFRRMVLIVQHRGANAPSMLARLLSKRTKLTVKEAVDGEPMTARTVYVAPVGRHRPARGCVRAARLLARGAVTASSLLAKSVAKSVWTSARS